MTRSTRSPAAGRSVTTTKAEIDALCADAEEMQSALDNAHHVFRLLGSMEYLSDQETVAVAELCGIALAHVAQERGDRITATGTRLRAQIEPEGEDA